MEKQIVTIHFGKDAPIKALNVDVSQLPKKIYKYGYYSKTIEEYTFKGDIERSTNAGHHAKYYSQDGDGGMELYVELKEDLTLVIHPQRLREYSLEYIHDQIIKEKREAQGDLERISERMKTLNKSEKEVRKLLGYGK